jgi:MHS family alpha-ketoglutarate permease-like MFS transporter
MLQGFSTGGEFQGSAVFLAEHAPAERRALASSSQMVSIGLAILLATLTATVTTSLIPQPALGAWGWRLPFFLGALLSLYGVWLRRALPETPAFQAVERRGETERHPLSRALRDFPRESLFVFVIQMGTVQFYIWTVFLPTYARLAGGLPLADGLLGSTIALAIYCVTIPMFAALSDRIGRKPLLYFAVIGFLVLTWPMLTLLRRGDFTTYLVVDIAGILLISASNSVLAPVLSELFPARVRTSGIGLPYAICSAVFGGTTPLIAAALVGNKLDWALAAYIMAICLVAIVTYRAMPETRGRALD